MEYLLRATNFRGLTPLSHVSQFRKKPEYPRATPARAAPSKSSSLRGTRYRKSQAHRLGNYRAPPFAFVSFLRGLVFLALGLSSSNYEFPGRPKSSRDNRSFSVLRTCFVPLRGDGEAPVPRAARATLSGRHGAVLSPLPNEEGN